MTMQRHPKEFIRNWRHDLVAAFAKSERDYGMPTDRGTPREEALRGLLASFLPKRYGVTTGHVVSAEPAWSRQADLIIYDALECPTFYAGGGNQGNVVPIEAVYGIIEVKSTLGEVEFADAVEKARAFKELCAGAGELPLTDRFAAAFFYRMPTDLAANEPKQKALLDECIAKVTAVDPSLDVALILSGAAGATGLEASYLMQRLAVVPPGTSPTSLKGLPRPAEFRNLPGKALPLFLFLLMNTMRDIRTGPPDLLPYLFEEGVDVVVDRKPRAETPLLQRGRGFLPIRDAAIEALGKVTKLQACPSCGAKGLYVDETLYTIVARQDYVFGRLGGPHLPTVVLVCPCCGLVMLHSSNVLGLTKFLEK